MNTFPPIRDDTLQHDRTHHACIKSLHRWSDVTSNRQPAEMWDWMGFGRELVFCRFLLYNIGSSDQGDRGHRCPLPYGSIHSSLLAGRGKTCILVVLAIILVASLYDNLILTSCLKRFVIWQFKTHKLPNTLCFIFFHWSIWLLCHLELDHLQKLASPPVWKSSGLLFQFMVLYGRRTWNPLPLQ